MKGRPFATLVAVAMMSAAGAQAAEPPAGADAVLAPHARVEGASIGEWTGRWWRWALSQPIAPFLDPDGRICDEGQDGPVWYLAGTNGQFTPKRECVVPAGKYLLVPIINMVYWQPDARQPLACRDLQASAAANNDHLISAVVLVDGKPVADVVRYRERSEGCFVLDHDENGAELRGAADGYWLMLKPLPPGRHTISVGANYGAPDEVYGHMLQNFEYVLDIGDRSVLSDANDVRGNLLAGLSR